MSPGFFIGVLSAEAISQVAIGLFFGVAYWLVQCEAEYLVFALLSWSVALISGGIAWGVARGPEIFPHSAAVTHVGGVLCISLHLMFVALFVRVRSIRPYALTAVLVTTMYLAFILGGFWWRPTALTRLGRGWPISATIPELRGEVTLVGASFYLISGIFALISLIALIRAYRSNVREAGVVLGGGALAIAATANDSLVVVGWLKNHYLIPHVFMLYSFLVALSLLMRYQRASRGLVVTATTLKERSEELRRSYADLEDVQRELVTKKQLAAVGELAAAIAHEVRNPLAIIVNAVAGLRRPTCSDPDRITLLGIVDEETGRLNRLVTDLLRFARPVTVRRAAVGLHELAKRAEWRGDESHEIIVELPDEPELRTVQADANLLRLVFDNLVSNACQSMPNGGQIRIAISRGNLAGRDCVRIDVIDQGQGMDEQVLSRAIDPFFTTRPSGTGLGLPIVQRIIEAHGGAVEIDSELGRGTIVSLLLPMDPDALGANLA